MAIKIERSRYQSQPIQVVKYGDMASSANQIANAWGNISSTFFKEAAKKKIAIIARVPLASGLLTGKMNQNSVFPENDHRNYNINGEAFDIGETFSGVIFNQGVRFIVKLKELLPNNF